MAGNKANPTATLRGIYGLTSTKRKNLSKCFAKPKGDFCIQNHVKTKKANPVFYKVDLSAYTSLWMLHNITDNPAWNAQRCTA
jgi:hypothetical protein